MFRSKKSTFILFITFLFLVMISSSAFAAQRSPIDRTKFGDLIVNGYALHLGDDISILNTTLGQASVVKDMGNTEVPMTKYIYAKSHIASDDNNRIVYISSSNAHYTDVDLGIGTNESDISHLIGPPHRLIDKGHAKLYVYYTKQNSNLILCVKDGIVTLIQEDYFNAINVIHYSIDA